MCCFSRPVKHVSATQIYARPLDEGRQALVYSMDVEIDSALAMVLPLPVTDDPSDDAVTFVDLSGYPKFFHHVRDAFPVLRLGPKTRGFLQQSRSKQPKLVVHDVGDFEASFVPTQKDFDRLDERFRLSPVVFQAHAEYADYGFAVFQLKPLKSWMGRLKRQTVHPMAFTFPSRQPASVFYPTLHVHDGTVPKSASFDHSLYLQTKDELLLETLPFERSSTPLGEHVDTQRAKALIDGASVCLRNVVVYDQPNEDQWYEPPRCKGVQVLRGGGEGQMFVFHLAATATYYSRANQANNPAARRWHRAATKRLDALHDGLTEGLRALTEEKREEWDLVPITAALRLGSSARDIPVRVTFSTASDAAEPQRIELGFRSTPSSERMTEIRSRLNQMVDRAVKD